MNEELTRKQEPEVGADLPEGRSGERRGETARQLIRRAKYATRRKFPAEEKIRIVMEGIRAEVRSEEHTSELQSPVHLVGRLLLEKKKNNPIGICLEYNNVERSQCS